MRVAHATKSAAAADGSSGGGGSGGGGADDESRSSPPPATSAAHTNAPSSPVDDESAWDVELMMPSAWLQEKAGFIVA